MDVAEKVIVIGLGLVLAGILLPIGLNEIANASMTNVDPAVQTIVTLILPILGVIGIAYAFYKN